ncbi:MAG: ClbS/DfsB family four-helix bundle protein [Pseudomonadota bacterium]
MPAATSQAQLLEVTQKEFTKLQTLTASCGEREAMDKDSEATSIRDVVVHRAHWIGLFLGWCDAAAAGRAVHMPAEGYGWADLKALNARIREENDDVSWSAALKRLGAAHQLLMQHLKTRREIDLYGGPMVGGNGKWTEGRYAESAGPSHYRSACKYIRARLREMR